MTEQLNWSLPQLKSTLHLLASAGTIPSLPSSQHDFPAPLHPPTPLTLCLLKSLTTFSMLNPGERLSSPCRAWLLNRLGPRSACRGPPWFQLSSWHSGFSLLGLNFSWPFFLCPSRKHLCFQELSSALCFYAFLSGFLAASVVENLPASAREAEDVSSVPQLKDSPIEANGSPLQYPCRNNPVDRGAWQAAVLRSQRAGRTNGHACTHVVLSAP